MNSFNWLFPVYFVYGLAFFSLGLVVLMEILRIPSTTGPARLLRPLCVFGFLHSLHEWSELFVIEMGHHPISITFGWGRILLLAFSFVALWLYGLETFRYARPGSNFLTRFGFWTLPVYALVVILDVALAFWQGRVDTFQVFNSLTRYLLAVPSAALATIGLRAAALKAQHDQRRPLDVYLNWAAIGFATYSLTQLFVPQMDTFLANILNAGDFAARTGLPIQALRTVIALLITFNIFQAVNFLEKERQAQLEQAQQERLKALEQQEILRRELLQHTVLAQEEERAHVARELHDEMAQTLTAFSLDLGALQKIFPRNVKAAPILKRLQELSRQMSQGMYRMVRSLRPAHLDELGHARATETRVCLCYQTDSVQLSVGDNGQGFDPTQSFSAPHGWGLAGMKERAESVGGSLRVESAPGKGTNIEIWIPYLNPKGEQ
ncbi:MAG: histidine kinase [Chloroflexi bacterium]|nr:histidine kinase [Chloroflexota bacterium]